MTDVVFTNEMDEEMLLNMGPHHPSTHGVLRFIVQSDSEIIRKAVPDVGYLHRSIEKIEFVPGRPAGHIKIGPKA